MPLSLVIKVVGNTGEFITILSKVDRLVPLGNVECIIVYCICRKDNLVIFLDNPNRIPFIFYSVPYNLDFLILVF